MVHMWLLCYICVALQMRIVIRFIKILFDMQDEALQLPFWIFT